MCICCMCCIFSCSLKFEINDFFKNLLERRLQREWNQTLRSDSWRVEGLCGEQWGLVSLAYLYF